MQFRCFAWIDHPNFCLASPDRKKRFGFIQELDYFLILPSYRNTDHAKSSFLEDLVEHPHILKCSLVIR